MAVGQTVFQGANGSVLQLHAQGAIAKYLTTDPNATAFRYTSAKFTSFGQAWFFENFEANGANAYLGSTASYVASRNKDLHEMTMVRYELPGLMNAQYDADATSGGTLGTAWFEVVHPDILQHMTTMSGYAGLGSNLSTVVSEKTFIADDGALFKRKHSGQPYYTDGVAIAAIKSVEYSIGGQRMDRHDKYAIYTWHILNSGSVGVPKRMMGLTHTHDNYDLELKLDSMAHQVKYCPLVFSFCRSPSMSATLISTMYNNLTLQFEFEPFSALICNYSGAGVNGAGNTTSVKSDSTTSTTVHGSTGSRVLSASTLQVFTVKRQLEDTLANSYARGQDLRVAAERTGTAALFATDLSASDFPVSIVSRVFFLGPNERVAFASNSFYQNVEACQRLKQSTTQVSSKEYRTDTFQNAASVLIVVPLYKPRLAANEYFTMGGAYDFARNRHFPAINEIEFETNGATQFARTDQTFYTDVQPYMHHSNVLEGGRRVYAMNFGIKANGRGPVQSIGYLNLSRTSNSKVTCYFASNLWATASGDGTHGNYAASATTNLDVELILWAYNILQYRGGIAGYRFTQTNNSL